MEFIEPRESLPLHVYRIDICDRQVFVESASPGLAILYACQHFSECHGGERTFIFDGAIHAVDGKPLTKPWQPFKGLLDSEGSNELHDQFVSELINMHTLDAWEATRFVTNQN